MYNWGGEQLVWQGKVRALRVVLQCKKVRGRGSVVVRKRSVRVGAKRIIKAMGYVNDLFAKF